jgi:hypothetical protein
LSKTLFTFLLSELKTARLICQRCKAVAEMPTETLGELYRRDTFCPACNMKFPRGEPGGEGDYFRLLVEAIRGLRALKQEIEFVVDAPSDKAPAQK